MLEEMRRVTKNGYSIVSSSVRAFANAVSDISSNGIGNTAAYSQVNAVAVTKKESHVNSAASTAASALT